MGRLLDEDMVINALQTTKFRNDLFVDRGYARAISIIRELPTIQPEKAQLSQEGTTFDLISRAAAQTEVMMKCERYTLARESHGMGHVEWSSDLISVGDAMDAIRDLPSAQPEPQEGHWIRVAGMNECCSACNKYFPLSYFTGRPFDINYCPHCGAKMKGAQNG